MTGISSTFLFVDFVFGKVYFTTSFDFGYSCMRVLLINVDCLCEK